MEDALAGLIALEKQTRLVSILMIVAMALMFNVGGGKSYMQNWQWTCSIAMKDQGHHHV